MAIERMPTAHPKLTVMKTRLRTTSLATAALAAVALSLAHAQDPKPVGEVELLEYWDFESENGGAVAGAWNGHVGYLGGMATLTDGGQFGNSLDTSALEGSYFVIDSGDEYEDPGDNTKEFVTKINETAAARDQLSVVFWQRNTDELRDQVGWWMVSPGSGGTERGAQGHTPWSNNQIYFDTAGCCDASTQRINGASTLEGDQWMEWNHFAFVRNGEEKAIWVNGEVAVSGTSTDPLPTDIDRMYFGNGIEKNRDQPGLMDELGVIDGALSEAQIKELAGGASVIDIFDPSDPNFSISSSIGLGQLPGISEAQELTIKLKNTGDTMPLTLSSIAIVGGDTDNFTIAEAPASVPAEGTADLKLSFVSNGEFRVFSVDIEFQTDDPDAEDQVVVVPVRATVVNPDGPIHHWPLDEATADASALDINASGGGAANGAYGGPVTVGQDGLQDGTGTSITTGGGAFAAALPENRLQSFTLALWMRPDALGDLSAQDFRTVVAKGADNPAFGILEGSGELVWFGEADGLADALFLTNGLGLQVGTTYHVVQRYDHTTQTGSLWVDGVEVASGDVPAFEDLGSLYAGAFGDQGALPFTGGLDDVQLYDRALESEEIQFLKDNPGKGLTPIGDPDSDQDGLTDSEELALGTDPFNADSDGDGLPDGQEQNDFGTDPTLADTDGDGGSDGSESIFGSDPLDPDSKLGEFLVTTIKAAEGVEIPSVDAFKEVLADPAQIAESHVGTYTFINFRDNAQGNFPNDELPFPLWDSFGDRNDYGIHVTGKINVSEAGLRTFGVNSDDGFELLIDGAQVAAFPDARGSSDTFGSVDLSAGEHDIELFYFERGGGAQVELFVNTQLGAVEAFGDGSFVLLPGFGAPSPDANGNGLPDFWENNFFGNLDQTAEGDPDSDGLTNAQELDAGTNPTVADTDGDGIMDGAETDTDPTVADTDSDGLSDGEEIALGTDPTNRDTDNDGFGDGFENDNPDRDPLVAETGGGGPPSIEIIGTGTDALIGGDLTDPENDGLDALDAADDPSWNWVAITGNNEADFEGGENAFNIFDNKVGGGNDKWCCDDPTPENPLWVAVEFAEPISLTRFTITNGNDTPNRDPINWQIQGSNDGETWETIFVKDDGSIWSETRNEVALITLGAPSDPFTHIRYIVFDTEGPLHQLNEIEYFGIVGGAGGGGGSPNLVAHFPLDSNGISSNGLFEPSTVTDVAFGSAGATANTGTSATFNGSSSVIQHDWNTELNPESFTLALWAKSEGGAGAWNSPVTSRHDLFADGETSQGFLIYDNNPGGVWTFWSGNGPDAGNWQTLDGPAVNLGVWQHVAITYDNGTQMKKLYVDGELVAESNDSITPNDTTPFNIGAGQDFGDGFWFVGDLDDIGLWRVALSQEDIGAIMTGGVANFTESGGGGEVGGGDDDRVALENVGLDANGAFSVTIPDGVTMDIEYSTDLENWSVIAPDVTGDISETDAGRAGASTGYYRGVVK